MILHMNFEKQTSKDEDRALSIDTLVGSPTTGILEVLRMEYLSAT